MLQGFFTYLYGTSILFLLYVFCFLLQESACCTAGDSAPAPPRPPPPPPMEKKKTKEKEKEKGKEKKAGAQQQQGQQPQGQAARNKGSVFQVGFSAPRFRLGGLPRLQNVQQIWRHKFSNNMIYSKKSPCNANQCYVNQILCRLWGIMFFVHS